MKIASFTLVLSIIIFSQSFAENSTIPVQSDSAAVNREKMPRRSTWEEIAYLPGRIVYFPLKYTLRGLNFTIGFVDDSKIIPRIEDFMTSDDERRGIMPTYAARTGAGFTFYQEGVFIGGKDRNIVKLTATVWKYERQRYSFELSEFEIGNNLFYADFKAQYQKLTSESFFGFDPDAPLDDESNFSQEETTIELGIDKKLKSHLLFRASAGYQRVNITRGLDDDLPSFTDIYQPGTVPGYGEPVELLKVGASFQFDTKNRPGNPTAGFDAELEGGIYSEVGADDYGFYQYSLDFNKYFHLFYNRVLVFRIAMENTGEINDKLIPFYHYSELGSKETLRGFTRGRFRNYDKLLSSVEYRYPLWNNWNVIGGDFILFFDTGQVMPDMYNDVDRENFVTSYGCGIRLWNEEGLTGKIEFGQSKDEWRINVVLN